MLSSDLIRSHSEYFQNTDAIETLEFLASFRSSVRCYRRLSSPFRHLFVSTESLQNSIRNQILDCHDVQRLNTFVRHSVLVSFCSNRFPLPQPYLHSSISIPSSQSRSVHTETSTYTKMSSELAVCS